jgi:hypothetical protein
MDNVVDHGELGEADHPKQKHTDHESQQAGNQPLAAGSSQYRRGDYGLAH